jgi:uncharacterized protein YqeY
MRKDLSLASCVLAGLLAVGCDSKSNDTTKTTPPPATPPAQSTGNAVSDGVKNATGSLNNAANNAQTAATDAANNAGASGTAALDTAKQKLTQVADYINQKKYDLADSTLKEVEGMKASLPQPLQDQVANLRTQLDGLKAASGAGMNMPSMPGGAK